MKLQFKILLLLSIIFGVLILSFLSYQYIHVHEKELYYQENKKSQDIVIDKVIQLNRIKYEQLINDNSGWDDMVRFANHPDSEWAKDNVDFFVKSFKLSFVLVYNKEKKLAYQFGDSTYLRAFALPEQQWIEQSFADTAYTHHFQYCNDQLIEIFGATIVPAYDSDTRKTAPQGYLFIGRKWDGDYIMDHAQATSYQIDIRKGSDLSTLGMDQKKMYFSRNITDSAQKVIATLVFSKEDPLKENLTPFLYLSLLVSFIAFMAIIVFLFYFRRIILVPLSRISMTLNTRNTEYIEKLNDNTDEFKILGALILQFFWQEEVLKKKNTELQENNATKDKLFSIISHDLKNPIGNILLITDLLNSSLKDQDSTSQLELVELIGSQAKETLTLLETLLEWARSQTGQIQYHPQLLDLNTIIDPVTESLNATALMKNITIESELSDQIQIYADLNMMYTILRNLLTNAIKFTNPGGTIRISSEIKENEAEITIADNGIGMDKNTLAQIFKLDTKQTRTGTANEKGTGLGLIICKEFIERHGGHIRVTSETGKGSQFAIILPLSKDSSFSPSPTK